MSNDDLGLADLTENILRDWEALARNAKEQTSADRKIIALCRNMARLRAEVERLRGALRVMLDGCNEGVHHGPCADCEERARAALEGKP